MSNQIFFAKSTNQGAPQVTNSWGALVSLLKTILIDGYVVAPVQSVTKVRVSGLTSTYDYSGAGAAYFIFQQLSS